MQIERGQFRVTGLIPYDDDVAVHEREIPIAIPAGDEFKRLYLYKVNLVPTDEEHEGQKLGRITLVFHVVDNPIWLPAAFYAATAAIGAVGSWFVIDKVETFAETGIGATVTLAAAVAGLLLAWKAFAG